MYAIYTDAGCLGIIVMLYDMFLHRLFQHELLIVAFCGFWFAYIPQLRSFEHPLGFGHQMASGTYGLLSSSYSACAVARHHRSLSHYTEQLVALEDTLDDLCLGPMSQHRKKVASQLVMRNNFSQLNKLSTSFNIYLTNFQHLTSQHFESRQSRHGPWKIWKICAQGFSVFRLRGGTVVKAHWI